MYHIYFVYVCDACILFCEKRRDILKTHLFSMNDYTKFYVHVLDKSWNIFKIYGTSNNKHGATCPKAHAKCSISCFHWNRTDVVCRGSVQRKGESPKKVLFCRLYSGLSRLPRLLKDLQTRWIRLLYLVTKRKL